MDLWPEHQHEIFSEFLQYLLFYFWFRKGYKPFYKSYIRHHGGFALSSCKRVHLLVFGILSFSLWKKQILL